MFPNLSAADRHAYVYRVVSRERLLELFSTTRNVLVGPELWDDPFENFMRSTPTRLHETLRATTEGDAFIGKVRYLPSG